MTGDPNVDPIASALAMLGIAYCLIMWAGISIVKRIKNRRKKK